MFLFAFFREAFLAAVANNRSDGAGIVLKCLLKVCKDISNIPQILLMASQCKSWSLVPDILQCINSPSLLLETDAAKKTILHYATVDGQYEIIMLCLEKMLMWKEHGLSDAQSLTGFLNYKDVRKHSALWYACHLGQVDIAFVLLAFGAMPDCTIHIVQKHLQVWLDTAQIASASNCPLIQVACSRGLTAVVGGILKIRPDLLEDDACMSRCLSSTLISGKLATYRFLRDRGVKIHGISLVMSLLMCIHYTIAGRKTSLLQEAFPINLPSEPHLATGSPDALRFRLYVRWTVSSVLQYLSKMGSAYVTLGDRSSVSKTEGLAVLDQLLTSLPKTEPNSLTLLRLAALASAIGEPDVTTKLLHHMPSIATPTCTPSKKNPYITPQLMEYHITLTDMVLAIQKRVQASANMSVIFRATPEHNIGNMAALLACQRQMPEVLNDSVIRALRCEADRSQDLWAHVLCSLLLHRSSHIVILAIQKVMEAHIGAGARADCTQHLESVLTLLLHLAVAWKKVDMIQPLLDLGVNCFGLISEESMKELNLWNTRWFPKSVARKRFTAFHWAFYLDSVECLKMLLSGVSLDPNISEEDLKSELGPELWLTAISRGHISMLHWLTGEELGSHGRTCYDEPRNNIDFDRLFLEPIPLLFAAAKNGKLQAVHWLLNRLSLDTLNTMRDTFCQGENLYHSLAVLRNEGAVIELIDKLIILNIPDINSVDQHGFTPLDYAQQFGNLKTQAHFLQCGASLDQSKTFDRKWCFFHGALRHCLDQETSPITLKQLSTGSVRKMGSLLVNVHHQVQVSEISQSLYQRLLLKDDRLAYFMLLSIESILWERTMPATIRKYLLSLVQNACRSGCPMSLKRLLDLLHDQWDVCEAMLCKCLLLTVKRCHVDCVNIFRLADFPDLKTAIDEQTGENLLHLAVRTQNKEMIRTVASFIGDHVRLTEPNLYGLTPVTYAESLDGMTHILVNCIPDYSPSPQVRDIDQTPKHTPDPEDAERQRVFQPSLTGVANSQEISKKMGSLTRCMATDEVRVNRSHEVDGVKKRINSQTIPALKSLVRFSFSMTD